MQRFSSSWQQTLAQLGSKRKRRQSVRKRRTFESLENRLVFSVTTAPQVPPPYAPPPPCDCAQAGVGADGGAESESPPLPGGLGPVIYGSDTQPHPSFNLNWQITPDTTANSIDEVLKLESVGSIGFGSAYFELPSSTMDSAFSFQVDAGGYQSGRASWITKISKVDPADPDTDLTSPYWVRTDQHIVNNDASSWGSGWQLGSLDRLRSQTLVDTSGHFNPEEGVSLITGTNQVVWFIKNTEDSNEITFERDQLNPYNFSELHFDKNTDQYTLTNVDGSLSIFDDTGLLLVRKDRFGNDVATYAYDGGELIQVTDQFHNATTIVRAGNYVTITDFCDEVTGDATPGVSQTTVLEIVGGKLLSVTQPDPDGNGPLASPVTKYAYNGDLLESITDPRNAVTTITYDTTRKVSEITERCGAEMTTTSLASQRAVDLTGNTETAPFTLVDNGSLHANDIPELEHRTYTGGREEWIQRNTSGQIMSRTDGHGNTTNYTYSIQLGSFPNASAAPGGYGLPLTETAPDPDGQGPAAAPTTSYGYDKGRVTYINRGGLAANETWSYFPGTSLVETHTLGGEITYSTPDGDGNIEHTYQAVNGDDRIYFQSDDIRIATYSYTNIGQVETVEDGNGNTTLYEYNDQGLIERITHAVGETEVAVEEFEYDGRNRLQLYTDARENVTEYVYDDLDRLIQRIDPDPDGTGSGNPLTSPVWNFVYDAAGNQTHVIDPLGNDTEYVFDIRGRLSAEIEHTGFIAPPVAMWRLDETEGAIAADTADSGLAAENLDGEVVGTEDWVAGHHGGAFRFDGDTSIEVDSLVTNSTNVTLAAWAKLDAVGTHGSELISLGNAFAIRLDFLYGGTGAFFYDGVGWQLLSVSDTFAGDDQWHHFAATFDDTNNVFKFYIDGAEVDSMSVSGYSIVRSGVGTDTVIGRHGDGSDLLDFDGMVDDVGVYDYALSPAQIAELFASGPTTEYEWDCNNNLVSTTDPMGRVTEFEPDDRNRIVTKTSPDPDGFGGVAAGETHYTYNNLGWRTSETNAEGDTTFWQYDQLGLVTHEVKVTGAGLTGVFRDGGSSVYDTRVDPTIEFDTPTEFFGNTGISEESTATWTGAIRLDFDEGVDVDDVTFYLDNTDYAQLVIDGDLVFTRYSTLPNNATRELAAGWHTIEVYFEDANDFITGHESELTLSYDLGDGNGKVPVPSSALGTTQVTSFTYDGMLRLESLTDPNGDTTTWIRDEVGHVTEEQTSTGTRFYEYYDGGQLKRTTDRNGRVTEFAYDHRNRLETEDWFDDDEDTTSNHTISYDYDDNSNLLLVVDGNAGYAYMYDNLNRRKFASQGITGLQAAVEFRYSYDDGSRMTSSSATIYDVPDYIKSYAYDAQNRLTTVTQSSQSGGNSVASKRVDMTYFADGQLETLTRYANTSQSNVVADSTYTYDGVGRLGLIVHDGLAIVSTFYEEHDYGYDKANRIANYVNDIDDVDIDYSYDATSQLVGAEDTANVLTDEAYAYDDNGNRDTFTVDAYNRISSDGTYTYEYDEEGNRTARFVDSDTDGQWDIGDEDGVEYAWDHRNRLTSVSYHVGEDNPTVVTYTYDAFNQLVSRREHYHDGSNELTTFVHDDGQIVLEFHRENLGSITIETLEATDLSRRNLWGAAVDQLLAQEHVNDVISELDGETLWALTDNLGSVRDMVDSDGNARIHRQFDSFGNIVDEAYYDAEGDPLSPGWFGYETLAFGYTGRPLDETTGLQNNLNRWYDSSIGRWMSEDPIGFAAGDANLYRYVGNEPTGWTDSLGLNGAPGQIIRDIRGLLDIGREKDIKEAIQRLRDLNPPGEAKAPGAIIDEIVDAINKRFPPSSFECVMNAKYTKDTFDAGGYPDGKIIWVIGERGERTLFHDGKPFSTNGTHCVVLLDDKIYDSISGKGGMTRDDYRKHTRKHGTGLVPR